MVIKHGQSCYCIPIEGLVNNAKLVSVVMKTVSEFIRLMSSGENNLPGQCRMLFYERLVNMLTQEYWIECYFI